MDYMRGSRNFFFSTQLILQKSNGQFKGIYHFSRFQGGGVELFSGGGPIGFSLYNLWFSRGGVRTPCPPSGSALGLLMDKKINIICCFSHWTVCYFIFVRKTPSFTDWQNKSTFDINYFWHTFCQQNLFLAYVLIIITILTTKYGSTIYILSNSKTWCFPTKK